MFLCFIFCNGPNLIEKNIGGKYVKNNMIYFNSGLLTYMKQIGNI